MNRNVPIFCLLVFALAAGAGCSSKPSADPAQKTAATTDKIQGKVQTLIESGGAMDAAMNAGGENSVYLWEGTRRYRLFLRKPIDVTHGQQYKVEGVYAQKAIDEIGDPDQGKNGYPLLSSCRHVITTVWKDLPMDAIDLNAQVLRLRVSRYPARPVFLVTRIEPVAPDAAAKKEPAAKEKEVREVEVPAAKQQALLLESPPAALAPLWEPGADRISCKVLIGADGKIEELQTGKQLCEFVNWNQYRYQPPVQAGHPVKVSTDVEVRFEPRKRT